MGAFHGLRKKTAGTRCPLWLRPLGGDADAVDDAMQALGVLRFPEDATVQDESHRIEEAPRGEAGVLKLLERGGLPLVYDLGYAIHVDHAGTKEIQDGVVGAFRREQGRAVATEGLLLPVAGVGEGFDHLGDEARKVTLGVRGVLAPDDMVCHERHVVATEDVTAEADADGEFLVVGVAEGNRIFVATVWGLQHHHAEIAHAVQSHTVALRDHLVTVEAQGVAHHVDEAMVRNRNVRGSWFRGLDVAQGGVVDRFGPAVEHERHGRSPL